MRNILVPMDLTEASLNALLYAISWKSPEDKLTVLHILDEIRSGGKSILLKPSQKEDEARQKLRNYITTSLSENQINNQFPIVIKTGETISVISKYSKKFNWIIAGTRDKYKKKDKWFGTISFGITKSIHCPLLLVPINSTYRSYKKVVVASDQHISQTSVLKAIRNWNQSHQAFLKFVHIQDTPKDNFTDTSDQIVKEYYDKEEVTFGFEVSVIHSLQISDSLLTSAYHENADLLIVIPDNQTFISSLLFRSIAKELILKSTIPILFLHNVK